MTLENFRAFCAQLKHVEEDFPFDQSTLAFKVGGKIFAITNIDHYESINLKCDPERALELRASNEGIIPGYHMNKKHWNTVSVLGEVDQELIKELTLHSYELVVNSLTKKVRTSLGL